jgi:alcohol dehydrogenase YqhD (iron-dependent ADH family)
MCLTDEQLKAFIEIGHKGPYLAYEVPHGDIVAIITELLELREENKNLRNELNEQTRLLGISGSKEMKLIAENQRMREALEFYAELGNYQFLRRPELDDKTEIDRDLGEKARKALQGERLQVKSENTKNGDVTSWAKQGLTRNHPARR